MRCIALPFLALAMRKEAGMTMRKAVFSIIAVVMMLFAFSGPADAAWSEPRYRGPFTTEPECEATRATWEGRLPDIEVSCLCTWYQSGAPKPGGGMGGPGYYFIYRVNLA
jgi:hypothetical protein